MDKKEFSFRGEKFKGVRQWNTIEDFKTITSNIYSPVMTDEENAVSQWNYNEFYKEAEKAGYGKMDLFLMNGKYHVIPCRHFLSIYGEADDIRWREMLEIESELNLLSFQKGSLMNDLKALVVKSLKTKDGYKWVPANDGITVSTVLYSNGYIEAEVKKLFLQDHKICLIDGISGESFNDDDLAFTVDTFLDILNSFVFN